MVPKKEKRKYVHLPVMVAEVLDYLEPVSGKIIVDATLGGGGHAEAILRRLLPAGKLIGIDRDRDALQASRERLSGFGDHFLAVKANFNTLAEVIGSFAPDGIDGLLFDLGVSSYQLDNEERGFSYTEDVFLDMRMDRELPKTAADLLKELPYGELAKIFAFMVRKMGRPLLLNTPQGPVTGVNSLLDHQRECRQGRRQGGHPAKRVFQALRIAVNGVGKYRNRFEAGHERFATGAG